MVSATGSVPVKPNIPGADKAIAMDAIHTAYRVGLNPGSLRHCRTASLQRSLLSYEQRPAADCRGALFRLNLSSPGWRAPAGAAYGKSPAPPRSILHDPWYGAAV